jgi:hypothetical protein
VGKKEGKTVSLNQSIATSVVQNPLFDIPTVELLLLLQNTAKEAILQLKLT